MKHSRIVLATAIAAAFLLPLGLGAQISGGAPKPEFRAGIGIEGGVASLMAGPVAEVRFPLAGPLALGLRAGVQLGTLQGQDLYVTASARAYLGWMFAEAGASWRAIGLPPAGAGQLLLPAEGVWPMAHVGFAIPAGERLRVTPSLGWHFTDMKLSASGGGGSIIGIIVTAPFLVVLGGVRLGLSAEYSIE